MATVVSSFKVTSSKIMFSMFISVSVWVSLLTPCRETVTLPEASLLSLKSAKAPSYMMLSLPSPPLMTPLDDWSENVSLPLVPSVASITSRVKACWVD